MSCVSPDGKPTESGLKMLKAIQARNDQPEAIASGSGLPLFRVRSGLRDMLQAGYVTIEGESYKLTRKGIDLISK